MPSGLGLDATLSHPPTILELVFDYLTANACAWSVTRFALRITILTVQQDTSSALFGNSHMAGVACWIAVNAEVPVTVRDVAAALGLADSVVRPVFLRLAAADLIRPLPKAGGARGKQHYERLSSDLWEPLTRLVVPAEEANRRKMGA